MITATPAQETQQVTPQEVPALAAPLDKLSIRNVRSAGEGNEGEIWSATLVYDGVTIGRFLDEATGGEPILDIKDEELHRELSDAARALYGYEHSDCLPLVLDHLRTIIDLEKAVKTAGRRGFEAVAYVCARRYVYSDDDSEQVRPSDFWRDSFADQRILLIPRKAELQQELQKAGAEFYIVREVPADKLTPYDEELDGLKRMLAKYRRTNKAITGVVLMQDGKYAGKVAQISDRITLPALRERFGFTRERVYMHGGRS